MAEEKKVTEIIQEIKSDVTEILGYVRDMDFKYNLLLDRINKLSTPSVKITAEEEITFPEYKSTPKKSVFEQDPNLKSKIQLALDQAQKDQDESNLPVIETHQEGRRRNLRQHAENQSRQIPVQQRICFPDNKPVFMASVDIFDVQQNLVKQTKTNQVGKWLASLSPGTYLIKVAKGSSPLKPKVELSYTVMIPNQDSTVDLGVKTVES